MRPPLNTSIVRSRQSTVFVAAILLLCATVVSAGSLDTAPKTRNSVYMDYSTEDVRALSPNSRLEVTVTGEKKSLRAWVTVKQFAGGWSIRVWPIERNVGVLWKPNSSAFALTDNRYANRSYVIIIGARFHMAGRDLGVHRVDVTPLVRRALMERVQRYYRGHFGISKVGGPYSLYVKALRWLGNDRLLIGVFAVTSLPMPSHKLGVARGVKGWKLGYLVNVLRMKIIRPVSTKMMQMEYGINFSQIMKEP